MIEVDNLSKFYGPRQAIKDLTFSVGKGEVVGFLGPNGAGKITTMNILCCILPASRGTARICGHDVFDDSLKIRQRIGYLPENPPLYQDMIVEDYLAFTAKIRGVSGIQVSKAVQSTLGKCGLKDVSGRIIEKLSKGFQQRVGLAQALIHNPEILILDEPTTGLDPIQIIEIRKLIQDLAHEHTIILSSHILPEVTQICKRIIIINEGEIVAEDSLEGLSASMRKTERIELKVRNANDRIVETLNGLQNVLSVQTESEDHFLIECSLGSSIQDEVAQAALDHRWGIVELKPVSLTLEDIFLKLTTEENEVKE